jgi:hypothetical protein
MGPLLETILLVRYHPPTLTPSGGTDVSAENRIYSRNSQAKVRMERTGFVALLDVLGFSALIASGVSSQRLQKYLECLEVSLNEGEGPKVDYVVFSDSLVLATPDSTEQSLKAILMRCSRLFGQLLSVDIAIRGAVGYGKYFWSQRDRSVFIAGAVIVDAYKFEQVQDWVGIMLTPSLINQMGPGFFESRTVLAPRVTPEQRASLRDRLPWAAFVQPCNRIPFHQAGTENKRYKGFAIVPTDGSQEPAALSASITRSTKALEWLKSLAPDPVAQEKYEQAYLWLQSLPTEWRDIGIELRGA